MKIRTTTRAITLGLLVLLVGALSVVQLPSATADEPEITITWPAVTDFNPDAYDYVVHISYSGPLDVWFVDDSGGWQQTSPGESHPTFNNEPHHRLVVELCPGTTGSSCRTVGASPDLTLYRSIRSTAEFKRLGPDQPTRADVVPEFRPDGSAVDFDVTWRVVPVDDPNAAPLVAGSASGVTSFPPIGANNVLVDGMQYLYEADMSATGPVEWGTLVGTKSRKFTWDTTPPDTASVVVGARDREGHFIGARPFYPEHDNYADLLLIDAKAGPGEKVARGSYEILDTDGSVVRSRSTPWSLPNRHVIYGWNGHDEEGRLVPEGRYSVVVRLYDEAGNARTFRRVFGVSHARIVTKTFRRTYPAARTVTNEFVGNCARLAQPARAQWPGSLGYLSSSPCRREDQMVVQTTDAVRIPRSKTGVYKWSRVTVTGGRSTSAPSYLVLWYFDPTREEWAHREQLDDRVGNHRGRRVSGEHTVLGADGRAPYVAWNVGLTSGAKYDVKSFTVEVRYETLQ